MFLVSVLKLLYLPVYFEISSLLHLLPIKCSYLSRDEEILKKILKRTSPKAHGIEVKSESYA